MEKEKLYLLNRKEGELHAIMGLMGISLPQPYAIALLRLQKLIQEKGLSNITVNDAVHIKHEADLDWELRCEHPDKVVW